MPEFYFRAILAGNVDAHLDELFEAGCGDATFGMIDGVPYADFCREAATRADALTSAIHALESVSGMRVLHIQEDEETNRR